MQKFYNKKSSQHVSLGVYIKKSITRNILMALGLFIVFTACEDYFEPKVSNQRELDQFIENPNLVRGFLTFAYRAIPDNYVTFNGDFLDCATDNSISNVTSGNINKMLEIDGFWTDVTNPLNANNAWQARYEELKNVNQFLEIGLDPNIIYYPSNLDRDEDYRSRLEGEAYFLRAYIHFDLLRRFGGIDSNGELMGIPLLTSTQPLDEGIDLPRNTYSECIQQIIADIDQALTTQLPDAYPPSDIGDLDVNDFGLDNLGRPTSIACKSLKSRVLLYAASPAFQTSSYNVAAQAAYDVIELIGTTLPSVYNVNNISSAFYNNSTNDELIMRRRSAGANAGTNSLERSNFPPSLEGNGRTSPSQNLVDAFPMANGYPINNASSGYDEDNMYENRDPRLSMTVIYNNTTFKGEQIETFQGGNNVPGSNPNITIENSTRTGYYLRKWLSSAANVTAANDVTDFHYFAVFRKVEMFLNFAEAANEAFGPDGGAFGLTARQAVAEIRRRAGIASSGSDDYLASITSKEDMRALIKNERRIELCFEGQYFFDVRRWEDNLTQPVKGVTITNNNGDFDYSINTVLTPKYKDFMKYGPLPFDELLKVDNLTQNQGW